MLANFHVAVSGVAESFFWKYGDRLLRMNLCRCHVSEDVVSFMSVVTGVCRVSREVTCEAKGCSGSVVFE